MRSIGARLARGYALAATLTLATMLAAGYQMLYARLIYGLDGLNAAEFRQMRSQLESDYPDLTPAEVDRRIRQTTDAASVLFYINIQSKASRDFFKSRNLNGQAIPDVRGKQAFSVSMPAIGELRVGEFIMRQFDVEIATPMAQVRAVMRAYVEVSAALLVVLAVASASIGALLSRLLLRPLRAIRDTALRIGSDNLSERIPITGVEDELTNLAALLNTTFARLETSFMQIRRFAAEASHELRTPLSLIRLHAEQLAVSGRLHAEQREAVQDTLEEVERLGAIIDGMLFLSRAEAAGIVIERHTIIPGQFLEQFQQDAQALCEHGDRVLAVSHSGVEPVAVDAGRIRQVLLNLLSNAITASPPGGLISIESVTGPMGWQVSVADQGRGLGIADCDRIFERFVRVPAPGAAHSPDGGSGLGLAICRSIIELHHGRIHARPRTDGCGLIVTFMLPPPAADFSC